jgi:hypothetical protein|tara:strand:- start:518 stop:661 length:144 start_codon:yes stop_codon:yes gene_type:complete
MATTFNGLANSITGSPVHVTFLVRPASATVPYVPAGQLVGLMVLVGQ